jgi:hypothetical protein
LIIEAANSFGGTWSKDRLYPGLKSNNMWGSYEHPDYPMSEEIYGVKEGEHIPGEILHRYLSDFASKFGIRERTRFSVKANQVEATAVDTWLVRIISLTDQTEDVLHTKRLIIATGLTSQPNIPTYPGQETFTPPFFHAKDFFIHGEMVNTVEKATVVGAGKSAFDVAYEFATSGAKVDLMIRPTGQGPVWICPPYVTPFRRKLEELLSTRLLSWFSPAPWGSEDGFGIARTFLHGTGIGRFIVDNFWNQLSNEVYEAHGYHDRELFKLKPWNSVFWTGSGVSIHNYPTSFFDLVKKGQIRVYHADIVELEGSFIYLTNGERLKTDVLVCCTGWKKESELKFVNFDIGLQPSEVERKALIEEADRKLCDTFPILRAQPVLRSEPVKQEPHRNYRFMVPTQFFYKRNIAFAGMVSTVCTSMFATTQGLWISAFLDGKLSRTPKSDDDVTKEVLLHTQFEKWRYPCGYGATIPDFTFDSLPYVDLLLNDLGLKNHRKATQIAEITEPYKPWDYKGLTQEWLASRAP